MKSLFLITNDFPYHPGGSFISKEIFYLSEVFDKIYVFTIGANNEDSIIEDCPNNVKCYPLNCYTGKNKYLYYIVKGFSRKFSHIISIRKNRYLMQVIASMYVRGRALDIVKKIYKIIKIEKLDIRDVVLYSYWFSYQAVAGVLLSELLKNEGITTTLYSRAHGYDLYWERAFGKYLPYQDCLIKYMKMVFPCCEYGREYLINKYPWASKKIKVERLGTFDFGLNPYHGERILVTCSNLQVLKRVELFARAFSIIAKEDKSVYWICIGEGEEHDRIEDIVKFNNIADQVLMTGRLSNMEVMEIYRKNGIKYFCNVSTTEGLPVSIMEAMSFGIPVIATNVGGTSELVSEDNGLLLPDNIDEILLAEELKLMLNLNEERYIHLRESSRNRWKRDCSADTNYKAFCEMISK